MYSPIVLAEVNASLLEAMSGFTLSQLECSYMYSSSALPVPTTVRQCKCSYSQYAGCRLLLDACGCTSHHSRYSELDHAAS